MAKRGPKKGSTRGKANGRIGKARGKSKPRQQALPTLEDHAIKELEAVAAEYAEIRDQRMELTKEESTLKQTAIRAMRKHNKTIYRHGGITIQLVDGEVDVKVKIKKPKADEDEEPLIEESVDIHEAADPPDPMNADSVSDEADPAF